MKLEELRKKASGIAIAAIIKNEGTPEETWSIHIINLNDFPLENVLINSFGFGVVEGEEIKTSQLRHYIELIPGNSSQQIELITEEVFHLNNQYMVTYYIDKNIFDKKFIFESNSINKSKIHPIDDLNAKGVLLV